MNERDDQGLVQQPVAQTPIETLDEGVLRRSVRATLASPHKRGDRQSHHGNMTSRRARAFTDTCNSKLAPSGRSREDSSRLPDVVASSREQTKGWPGWQAAGGEPDPLGEKGRRPRMPTGRQFLPGPPAWGARMGYGACIAHSAPNANSSCATIALFYKRGDHGDGPQHKRGMVNWRGWTHVGEN